MILRPRQDKIKSEIYSGWSNGARNVLAVAPCGFGKTVVMGSIIHEHRGASCTIAHRKELVGQMSLALAKFGVPHKILGPDNLVKDIVAEHMHQLGTNFVDPNARCGVAGVDTLNARHKKLKHWLDQVTLWVQDEAHHVLRDNKWGKAAALMPNAKGLGVTATPVRADRKGLASWNNGLMDMMVEGPTMRKLINEGDLADYIIYAPPSDLDLSDVTTAKDGDYNKHKLKKAVQRSHLVGDVVTHYLRVAKGKQGITFVTDLETATEISNEYNLAGIPSEVISSKTPERLRNHIIRRYRNKELWQLVNVDILGEGFDVPGAEVVSMARPTKSYGLYVQQYCRVLRIDKGNPGKKGIILDHAGNVARHKGPPDKERIWSLDVEPGGPRMKNAEDEIPVRYCVKCTQPYERFYKFCPHCGHYHEPEDRGKPEYVDGDLMELTPDVLAAMRGEVARIDEPSQSLYARMKYAGAPLPAANSAAKKQVERQEAQAALRNSIAWWAGIQRHRGHGDSESYRIFYHIFGIDVLSANALGRPDAIKLAKKINNHIGEIA